MPEILVKYEDRLVERVVTQKKRISIGRTADNDIVLDNKAVSRKHALIEFDQDSALIIDNESLNGVFVNNRKVSEEVLKDNDQITIGKFDLIYHRDAPKETQLAELDGTLVLDTRKQKELLEKDRKAREATRMAGGSVLLAESDTAQKQYALNKPVITLGKARYAHVPVKGFLVSKIQAKIIKDQDDFLLVNLGRKRRTRVNGEAIQRRRLKNDDLIEIGRSAFRYLQGTNR
ncbi:MAG: FHA domain-containing protein [candidate division Zixibacteria bacterium]|nr:FHA domain-containing protein [candidate division Zixibacteria bacterium]